MLSPARDAAVLKTLASIRLLAKDFPAAEGYAREALSAGMVTEKPRASLERPHG
jgi:hypothetical protein